MNTKRRNLRLRIARLLLPITPPRIYEVPPLAPPPVVEVHLLSPPHPGAS